MITDNNGQQHSEDIVIKPDQFDVVQQLDISRHLGPGGKSRIQISTDTPQSLSYHVAVKYHVP